MTHIKGAPTLPIGYFYRLNPKGRTFGGPRETVEICEQRSFLWFKWIKVHASAGVYRSEDYGGIVKPPELRAACRAHEYWMWDVT